MSIDNKERVQEHMSAREGIHSPPSSPSLSAMSRDDYLYEQVKRYRVWLQKQHEHAESQEEQDIAETYAHNASQVVVVGEQNVQAYAPFRYKYSALKVITWKQVFVLVILFLAWIASIVVFGKQVFVATMGIITVAYLLHLVLDVAISLSIVRESPEERIDGRVLEALRGAEWPVYTILCPLYKEARVVPQFVKAMQGLDYPVEKLQILFLTEQDDEETRAAIEAMHLPAHFEIVTVPEGTPRTKPRACNFGLIQSIGQYVVIFDAEDVPDPLQLKKAVLTFANHGPNLACVQAKLNFYNPNQNMLTRWFTAEYSLWFDLILPGLQKARFLLPLGGTSNHFPTQMIRALGGWDAFNVTEDCDLGLRLAWFKLETVVLDSTTYEEANSRVKNWLRQRSRWIKGYMQTYLVHMREPWHYAREGRIREFLSMQLMIGGKTAVLFINPVLWLGLIVSHLLRPFIGNAYDSLFPAPLVAVGTTCLVVGNFFYLYIYLLACIRRKHYALVRWTLLIPLYWLLMSAAACIALYQLIVKPHYWEKTEHGLHLMSANDMSTILAKDGIDLQQQSTPVPSTHQNRVVMPTQEFHHLKSAEFPSVRRALKSIHNAPAAAFTHKEIVTIQHAQAATRRDPWQTTTLLLAACAGLVMGVYAYLQHLSTHLLATTASSSWSANLPIIDMTTAIKNAGVTLSRQHGGYSGVLSLSVTNYLPTGIMLICYIVTAMSVFIAARCLTRNSRASFAGTLLFLLSPLLPTLATLTLNDWLALAALTLTCCCFLLWIRTGLLSFLVGTAFSSLLATLVCYDGWALFVALLLCVLLTGWLRKQSWTQTESYLIAFGTLGALGVAIWMLLCGTLFGDPLAFLHAALSPTRHSNLQQALFNLNTPGLLLSGVALLTFTLLLLRRGPAPEKLAAFTFLVPCLFSLLLVVSDATGSLVSFASTTMPYTISLHLSAMLVAPAALLLAMILAPGGRRHV